MNVTNALLRKGQLIRDILLDVQAYELKFGKPMPLKILSAKYGLRANKLMEPTGIFNGFKELIRELNVDASLLFEMKETGAILVSTPKSIKLAQGG